MVAFIVALLVFFSTAFFATIFYMNTKQKPTKLFPGNNGLPLIGEILSFMKPHPANSMGNFMEDRISRYGKIFSSNLMGKEAIVSADPDLNRFVQNKDVKHFAVAWHPVLREIFGQNFEEKSSKAWIRTMKEFFGQKSFAYEGGERHKVLRNAFSELLSIKRLQTIFLEYTNTFASDMVKSWKDGSIIFAREESIKYALQIMAKSTISMDPDDIRMEMFLKYYPCFLCATFSLPIFLPGTKYWKAVEAKRNIIKTLKKIIARRIDSMSKDCKDEKKEEENSHKVEGQEDEPDFIDMLLAKRNDLTDDDIETLIFITLFAGHDTSARTIAFMMYQLAKAPHVVKRLQEEHLQIARSKSKSDYKLTWEDYKSMEFSSCVITEILRLSSVAPFTPKTALEEMQYKGIVIPRDSLVLISIRAVHFDPTIYDNPKEFDPWRWMGPNSEKNKVGYMPFGGGARMCPGDNLAKLEIAIFLHYLILNFEWEIIKEDQPMCLPYVEFPKGLPIKLHAIKLL